jgi:hypothetical protein
VSFKAALANWRPILRYCLSVFFFLSVFPSLVILVVSVIVPETLFPYVATAIFVPYGLCLIANLQISDYISYRDRLPRPAKRSRRSSGDDRPRELRAPERDRPGNRVRGRQAQARSPARNARRRCTV